MLSELAHGVIEGVPRARASCHLLDILLVFPGRGFLDRSILLFLGRTPLPTGTADVFYRFREACRRARVAEDP